MHLHQHPPSGIGDCAIQSAAVHLCERKIGKEKDQAEYNKRAKVQKRNAFFGDMEILIRLTVHTTSIENRL